MQTRSRITPRPKQSPGNARDGRRHNQNHPLPHGLWRDDVIGEVGEGLDHVPAVAGVADGAALNYF